MDMDKWLQQRLVWDVIIYPWPTFNTGLIWTAVEVKESMDYFMYI